MSETKEIRFHFPVKGIDEFFEEWVDQAAGHTHIQMQLNCRTGELVDVHIDCRLDRLGVVLENLSRVIRIFASNTLKELQTIYARDITVKDTINAL